VDTLFVWLESTAFSTWMRESPSVFAFPAILSCHTVGMGLAAGINGAIALRILGVASGIRLAEMRRFVPIMWFGFWLNAVSGVALLMAYPTKALTNPVFYLKLVLIAIAVWLVKPIGRRLLEETPVIDPRSPQRVGRATKQLAVASLVCWSGAITAGRLLAYTYSRLMASNS
jgi:hypothetical protein